MEAAEHTKQFADHTKHLADQGLIDLKQLAKPVFHTPRGSHPV